SIRVEFGHLRKPRRGRNNLWFHRYTGSTVHDILNRFKFTFADHRSVLPFDRICFFIFKGGVNILPQYDEFLNATQKLFSKIHSKAHLSKPASSSFTAIYFFLSSMISLTSPSRA